MGGYQQVIGSLPVRNVQPPPEGTMAAGLTFTLTSVEPSVTASLQLNSQGGIQLSQVVTLSIDNSDSPYAISVTHGVFNEVTTVPAYASIIIPTFSSQGGTYTLIVEAITPNSAPLTSEIQVNIICMNYPRTPGSFGNTTITSIAGGNQNVAPLVSTVIAFTGPGVTQIAAVGNYILDSLDIYCTFMTAASSGTPATLLWNLYSFDNPAALATIASDQPATPPATSDIEVFAGGQFTAPISMSWSQGLILPRGCSLFFDVS